MAEKTDGPKMTNLRGARYALEYLGEHLVGSPFSNGYEWHLSGSGFRVDKRDAEKLRALPGMELKPSALRDEVLYGLKS